MERNEIKLRKQLPAGDIHRHRNYEMLMKQHRRSKLFRRTLRYFIYSLIVTFIVLMLITLGFYVIHLKKNSTQPKTTFEARIVIKNV